MKWPSVIARNDGSKIRERVRLTDESLYYRDHGICAYCEKPLKIEEVTWDHVFPKSLGGTNCWENIVAACEKCNMAKGNNKPVGVWRPKVVPFKPTYYQLLNVRKKFPIVVDHPEWMQFLGDWEAEVVIRT